MTDVLEVLREYQKTTWPWAAVRCDHLSAAIAAIEERDAEIGRLRSLRCACDEESGQHDPTCPVTIRDTATAMSEEIATLTRQLAEEKEESERVWAQLRAVDDTLNALGCSQAETFTRSAAIQGIADEREKWLTASRVLCAAHVGVPQPTCPVCALTTATAQRDAMRGALGETRENLCALLQHHAQRHDDAVRDGMREGIKRINRALGAL